MPAIRRDAWSILDSRGAQEQKSNCGKKLCGCGSANQSNRNAQYCNAKTLLVAIMQWRIGSSCGTGRVEKKHKGQLRGFIMIAMFKAIPFGIFLTLIVALFIGSGGSSGGMLHVFPFDVVVPEISLDVKLYWSWTLFLAGTGLAFAILLMMD